MKVASTVDDDQAFTARAREAAEALGARAIGATKRFLYTPPAKPDALAGKHEGFGDWMWVCQQAIFEIWFHFGADALYELREFAFGVYDWTQAHATHALCRLALKGIDREGAAELIAEALPDWRYEQVMRVRRDVAALAAHSAVLRRAYDRLTDEYLEGDVVDAFELVSADAAADPAHACARYLPFLRGLMSGEGLEGRTAFDDGQVVTAPGGGIVAKSGPTYPQIPDYHRIRAALLLRDLVPGDAEVTAQLSAWSDTHPDEAVRRQLREILSSAR